LTLIFHTPDGRKPVSGGTVPSDGDDEAASDLSERMQAADERISSADGDRSRSASTTDEGSSMFDMMDE
jgi:hypothetical protein